MNKDDLIEAVTQVVPTRDEAKEAVDKIIDSLIGAIKKGERIIIHGFGTFELVIRRAKKGRNPRTGEPVVIPSRRAVKFKPSRNLYL